MNEHEILNDLINKNYLYESLVPKKVQLVFFICIVVYLIIRQKLGNPYYKKTYIDDDIQKIDKKAS